MSFQSYRGTPFAPWLLPIIPVGAPLTSGSKITEANLGKIPGMKYPSGWVGFAGWTGITVKPAVLAIWDSWYPKDECTIGLQGRLFPCIDADVNEAWQAQVIRDVAFQVFGETIVRGRSDGSPRQLLMYRLEQAPDFIHKFRRVYGNGKPSCPDFAVEILGKGQQYLIEGKHPKGGTYVWDTHPLEHGFENIPRISPAKLVEFIHELDEAFALVKVVPQRPKGLRTGDSGGGPGASLIGPDHPELAPSIDMLKAAIALLDVNDPEFADYDAWERFLRAMKTAAGGDETFYDEIYLPWNRNNPNNEDHQIRGKWESHVDSKIGWDYICSLAEPKGFVEHVTSQFDNLDEGGDPSPADRTDASAGKTAWQDSFAYIEPLKEFVDLNSAYLQRYDLQAFKLKFPRLSPWSPKFNAVIHYLQSERKTVCDGYTYRPGAPRLVEEHGRRLLNRWSSGLELLDRPIDEEEIRPWLDHLEYLIPDPEERAGVLDWLAHLVQRRQPKVNYAILLGGKQGIGKSLLFDPIGRILGPANVRTTSETEIKDKYTSWVAERELVMMEEIRGLSEEVMNRLKMYIAAPPYMVPVNEKHVKHYEVPNVVRIVAFTNSEYALQLSDDDRRWFVIWSPAAPRDPDYYTTLAKWSAENADLVGSWLAQRDLSGFAAQGRAPMTAAKKEMHFAAMGSLDYWVHEAIANGQTPFETDLVSVEDVLSRLPYELRNLRPTPTEKSIAIALKNARALKLARVSLGKALDTTSASRTVLWAVRRHEILKHLDNEKLVELFWKQRAERVNRQGSENLDDQLKKAG